MQHYHIWFDLKDGVKDESLVHAARSFMAHMQDAGTIQGWSLQRRTLGLSSADLGEWHMDIQVKDLAQLQEAFDSVTPRTGETEKQHKGIYAIATNLKFALYRDFPDANREI